MTHDEIIEVIKAHKDGKELQILTCNGWIDLVNESLNTILSFVYDTVSIRVKPEPTYVPWTADDWRGFADHVVVNTIDNRQSFTIRSWSADGMHSVIGKIKYSELLESYKIYPDNKPCGKLVEK